MKIGKVELENNIVLAPMAGISDLPFRIICKKYGKPGLVYTEMISSRGIFFDDEKTNRLLNIREEERPISVQIFGNNPEVMAAAASKIEKIADIIDINMGCPAPKIVKNGDGSKLLLNLDLAGEIVERVVKKVNVPVTVKIRKGFERDSDVSVEAAKVIEKAGASGIIVHGRTREEYYSGKVDLDAIKRVKGSVGIPVIGNGDIRSKEDMERMLEYTKVDGVAIGRGAIGRPWLFNEVTLEKRLDIIKEHIELAVEEKGEYIGIREMRKHICYYLKKLKNSSKVRETINRLEHKDEVISCLEKYFNTL